MSPDLVAVLFATVVLPLATWTYHKIHGDHQASLADMARGLVDQALHLALVKVDSDPAALRETVSKYVWLELGKTGLSNTGLVGTLISAAIEQGIGAALQAARAHDQAIQVAIAANMSAAQASIAATVKLAAEGAAAAAKVVPAVTYTEITDEAAYQAARAKALADEAASQVAALVPGPESVK